MKKKMGQSVMEYAVLLMLVSAAFVTMGLYVRRAIQGRIYSLENQVAGKANTTPTGYVSGGGGGTVSEPAGGWW
jgi:Flp pilus assembly pilin Flp